MNYYERTTEEQKIIDACIAFELSENDNSKNPYIEIIKAMNNGNELLNSIKNYIENL